MSPLWEMNAESPPGNYIGGVKQDHVIAFHQWFSVLSSSGETALKITKSTGQWFSPEVDFKVIRLLTYCVFCQRLVMLLNLTLMSFRLFAMSIVLIRIV